MNNEESLLKRSLVLTAKLVSLFALWTVLLSLLVVGITGRAVLALSGGMPEKGAAETKTDAARGTTSNQNVIRPNG